MSLAAGGVDVDGDYVFVLAVEIFLCVQLMRFHLRQAEEVGKVYRQEVGCLLAVAQMQGSFAAFDQTECVQFGTNGRIGGRAGGRSDLFDAFIIRKPGEAGVGYRLVGGVEVAVGSGRPDLEVVGVERRSRVGIDQDEAQFVGVLDQREVGMRFAAFGDFERQLALEEAEQFTV